MPVAPAKAGAQVTRLVIFDCDGVLIDSEPIANRVLMEQLAAAGLLPWVEGRLFTAAEVARPKPAPDLFVHAADVLGFAPDACVVVEDTPTGVKAALAAGMRAYAYTGAAHAEVEALRALGATLFDDMLALPGLLEAA